MRNPSSSPSSSLQARARAAASKKKSSGAPTPCCSKVGLKRGPWTPEEDEVLAGYIKREGEGRWRTLPKRAGLLRCGKSCRLRWMNYLRPSVKRGQIAPDEEDLILRLHRLLGNRWSLIAGRIPGRTDNEIKNYWNTHLSKKLISQGIDPRTHKPLPSAAITTTLPSNPSSIKSYLPTITNANYNNPSIPDHLVLEANQEFDPKINATTQHDHLDNAFDINLDAPAASAMDHSIIKSDNNVVNNIGDYDNDDMNDVFSSFLNSLINDDAFASLQSSEPPNDIAILPSDHHHHDAFISISAAASSAPPDYGLACSWEPPLLVPAATLTRSDPNAKRG